jgi:hypothetical protein
MLTRILDGHFQAAHFDHQIVAQEQRVQGHDGGGSEHGILQSSVWAR